MKYFKAEQKQGTEPKTLDSVSFGSILEWGFDSEFLVDLSSLDVGEQHEYFVESLPGSNGEHTTFIRIQ